MSEPDDRTAPDPQRRRLLAWLWRIPVLAAVAGAGYALYEGGRVIFGKEGAREETVFEPIEAVTVASLDDFSAPWDAVPFEVAGMPALAVRLPGEQEGALEASGLHLAAYSRVCTHQGCTVSLNRDLEAIAFAFNYRSETPAMVCPCHLSVFLPAEGGRPVSGPAVEPLPRVRLTVEEGEVRAVAVEKV